jgi:Phosphodiester glycosidase
VIGVWLPLHVLLSLVGAGLIGAEISEPSKVRQADLPHGLGTIRRLSCIVSGDHDGVTQPLIAVTLAPDTFQASLLDQSPTFPVGSRTVAVTRTLVPRAVVAINGGYFTPSFQPAGLCRMAGKEITPLVQKGVLSGILAVDGSGGLRLLTREAALEGYLSAVQAGPFVIDPGGEVGVRAGTARANRSLIALDARGRVLLLVTGSLTLHHVAILLHEHAPALGLEQVERALNLDGGPSTGLSLALDDPTWSMAERGPVRNVLVIAAPVP